MAHSTLCLNKKLWLFILNSFQYYVNEPIKSVTDQISMLPPPYSSTPTNEDLQNAKIYSIPCSYNAHYIARVTIAKLGLAIRKFSHDKIKLFNPSFVTHGRAECPPSNFHCQNSYTRFSNAEKNFTTGIVTVDSTIIGFSYNGEVVWSTIPRLGFIEYF